MRGRCYEQASRFWPKRGSYHCNSQIAHPPLGPSPLSTLSDICIYPRLDAVHVRPPHWSAWLDDRIEPTVARRVRAEDPQRSCRQRVRHISCTIDDPEKHSLHDQLSDPDSCPTRRSAVRSDLVLHVATERVVYSSAPSPACERESKSEWLDTALIER
ncbi:hypothetical protein BC628DRAFT_1367004 [Trametes gibbosa]|nr:hypothetical protein BC628DRAFT_1367004 [Trametes gibbosa]